MPAPLQSSYRARLSESNTASAALAWVSTPDLDGKSFEVLMSKYDMAGHRYCTLYSCLELPAGRIEQTLPLRPEDTDCRVALQAILRSTGFQDLVLRPLVAHYRKHHGKT